MKNVLGDARARVDAHAKVTGTATYAAEHQIDGTLHAVLVLAGISAGRIADIDLTAAHDVEGYVTTLSRRNAPPLNGAVTGRPGLDKHLLLFESDRIEHDRQPVAVVVARTLEAARTAAAAVRVQYETDEPLVRFDDSRAALFAPEHTAHDEPAEIVRGDAAAARGTAGLLLSAVYSTPYENHNPLEPHAAIAEWEGDRLTIYDTTQGVFEARRKVASVFGIPEDHVRVVSPFVGGGFGNKGSVWPHVCLAAAAAKLAGAAVKLELPRAAMFAITGHRPRTEQQITLGARPDGSVVSFEHSVVADTSTYDIFTESSGEYTAMAYAFANVDIRHRLVRLNVGTPTFMRAPGEATGTYALEAALDELAYLAGIDPIELRLRNYAERDPNKDKPFTSKYQRECYARGAERIGWNRRTPTPRSLRDGRELVGLGMAGGAYPAQIFNASARVTLTADGRATVLCGTHELGQGTYTALAQIAAAELGIDPAAVALQIGDTRLPRAMNSGGSTTIASVGSAVALACRDIVKQRAGGGAGRELSAAADFALSPERDAYSAASFAAQFAEVGVDPDFGTVRVRRMIGVFDVGRVVNERLTHSQLIGGMTMGLGMALLEETKLDPRSGRIMNANLADYLLPVNADIGEIDAEVIDAPYDDAVNPIGTKPVGEIGICGAAAAIANAIYHATGRRVRDLPITPRKLC